MTASFPEPEQLRGRLGREEFTQRLLTCLVLGRLERGWNITRTPSSAGALFLRDLHASAFGDDSAPEDVPGFVDEFELPQRTETEPSGWPDYGVVWPSRLFLVELKTERTSHRAAQVPYYLELAAHWHRDIDVDLLYLTPSMPLVEPALVSPLQRFAHLTWAEVAPLVEATWSHADVPAEREMASYLVDLIDEIETTGPQPPARAVTPTVEPGPPAASLPPAPADDVDRALELAAQTEADGVQRALESDAGDPAELDALRIEVRDLLLSAPVRSGVEVRHVLPWLWRAATSRGRAISESGRATGYELRLSRYERDVT